MATFEMLLDEDKEIIVIIFIEMIQLFQIVKEKIENVYNYLSFVSKYFLLENLVYNNNLYIFFFYLEKKFLKPLRKQELLLVSL